MKCIFDIIGIISYTGC